MNAFLTNTDELDEMVSYRKAVTGVAHTVFISPRGNARHAPRIKVAIDPPDSLDPRSKTFSIDFNLRVVAGTAPSRSLLEQVRNFIRLNRPTLLAYWRYEIDTAELQARLFPIDPE